MVLNIISSVDEITVWYDLSNILSVMIGCSATFVAIIGGLIANKAISDASEKESIDKQLQQIDAEITINNENADRLNDWLNEYEATNFINHNLESLLSGKSLEKVYDEADDNELEFDELNVYWNQAIKAIEMFKTADASEINNDDIPKSIVSKLSSFQYSFCSRYSNSIASGRGNLIETSSLWLNESRKKYYDENIDEWHKVNEKNKILIAKENLLYERQEAISISRDVKGGMRIFTLVSIINIVLPTIFMLFNPTSNKVWYYIETIISLITFSVGIIIMIKYIYSLFPQKDTKAKEMEPENDL